MTVKHVATLLVLPPLAGWAFAQFASSLPGPFRVAAFGLLALAALVFCGTMLVIMRREQRTYSRTFAEQTHRMLDLVYGEGVEHATVDELMQMKVPDLIELQSKLSMQQHLLGQLKMLELSHEQREQARHAYRTGYVGMCEGIARNDLERARLIQQAPDWEIWATL